MWKDFVYSLRSLRRSPLFTAAAVASLALGIGANTAIFSLLDQVVLRSLPVRDPESLVVLHTDYSAPGNASSDNDESVFSYPLYRDLRASGAAFSGIVARSAARVRLAWNGNTEAAGAELVSGNFFRTLGIGAALGRTLAPSDEGAPDANPVAVLSHAYWSSHCGSNPAIVNRTVSMNGHPFVVVGIAAASFNGLLQGNSPDVYVPLTMEKSLIPNYDVLADRRMRWLNLFGRLKPGETLPRAQAATGVAYHAIIAGELAGLGEMRDEPPALPQPPRHVASRRAGHRPVARQMGEAAARAHGHGGAGAVDRLRQRGGPDGGARGRPAARNRHSAGDGRAPRGAGAAVADRRSPAGFGGWRGRPVGGTVEHGGARRHAAAGRGGRVDRR
jgi:hypothetical protein